jgi:hypothetical protein
MIMTDSQKRQYVYNLYPGPKWKRRVDRMPDDQVTAIYLNHLRDGEAPEHDETELTEPLDLELGEPKTERLLEVSRGPHHNEDDFPIY